MGFYSPFLDAIYEKAHRKIAILAHAQLGHTAGIHVDGIHNSPSSVSLSSQIESVIEVVDAVISTFGASTKIIIAAHSVGGYISLQVSTRASERHRIFFDQPTIKVLKARPDTVSAVFLLFPTIAHISDTPNGQNLSVRTSSLLHGSH